MSGIIGGIKGSMKKKFVPVAATGDANWSAVSLLLNGDTADSDPNWSNVSLMLTGDDFIDYSNNHKAITSNNVTINTTTKKYGTGSLYFNGSNSTLSAPADSSHAFGTSDFTVEAWVYPTSFGTYNYIYCNAVTGGFVFYVMSNKLMVRTYNQSDLLASTTLPALNTWTHIAATRSGTTLRIFVNGVITATGTDSTNFPQSATFLLGGDTTSPVAPWAGYIDELRVTKGVARYTANFTPPTTALPSFKIRDVGSNSVSITPYGNAQISTTTTKYGTGSMYFDGTGDYLTTASTTGIAFGTGDFTIEMWFMVNSIMTTSDSTGLIDTRGGNDSTGYLIGFEYGKTDKLFIAQGVSSIITANTTYSTGVWNHVAMVRSNGIITLYQNGVNVGSVANTSNNTNTVAYIGTGNWLGPKLNGYIDDLRVTKGLARYTSNFTPPTSSFPTSLASSVNGDPNYSNVSLLLRGNGTNGSQTFTDESSNATTISVYGNAQNSTTVKKFGTGSLYFDGNGDYITAPASNSALNLSGGNWTIEFWAYYTGTDFGNYRHIITKGDATNGPCSYQTYLVTGTGYIAFFNGTVYSSTTVMPSNQWCHLAYTYSGSTLTIFLNGSSIYTNTVTISDSTSRPLMIGNYSGDTSMGWIGYLDDIRITKGIARYTANFTPPTYELPATAGATVDPNFSQVSLLLTGDDLLDRSSSPKTLSTVGNTSVSTSVKKYGTGSLYFDGNGDYLTFPADSSLALGTGDFTVEFWIYNTGNTNPIVNGVMCSAANTSIWTYYNGAWQITFGGTGNSLNFGWSMSSSGNSYSGSTTVTIPTNIWSHVAFTRVDTTLKTFLNGTLSATNTLPSSFNFTTDGLFEIGKHDGRSDYYLNGYLDDIRITKGVARYTTSFTPPTTALPTVAGTIVDPNYSQVTLLISGDGTNGSQSFTDLSNSPRSITAVGNAQVNTTTKKYGTGSMYFDGSGDYLSIPYSSSFDFGTGDFTIELWYKSTNTTENTHATFIACYSGTAGATSTNSTWSFKYSGSSGSIEFAYYNGSWGDQITSVGASDQQWHHLAVSRSGTDLRMFKDGIIIKTVTGFNVPLTGAGQVCTIGYQSQDANSYINGYMDDIRITKGVARYTANFTPPTYALPTA
jgi:hypothetical protein